MIEILEKDNAENNKKITSTFDNLKGKYMTKKQLAVIKLILIASLLTVALLYIYDLKHGALLFIALLNFFIALHSIMESRAK